MKRILVTGITGTVLVFTMSGCVTTDSQQTQQMLMRQQVELQNMKVEVEHLKGQINDLVSGQENIYRNMSATQSSFEQYTSGINSRMDEITAQLNTLSASREQLKQEIVDKMSKNVTKLIKSQVPAHTAQTGIEHTVASGDTLSTIAAAYHVSIKAIIRANNIKNPDHLKVGQKLFIPE